MPTQPTQRRGDIAAFLAVLVVGVTLIMSRSATAQEVVLLSSALGGLYSVWCRPLAPRH
ncbi:hypothetical protein [Streptomyces lydicamycinicus]|uniref:hypothetical protein n=1 Tax=Streptomyces lydicamycinicus TaxID=1546107 RepID=UPI003C2BE214